MRLWSKLRDNERQIVVLLTVVGVLVSLGAWWFPLAEADSDGNGDERTSIGKGVQLQIEQVDSTNPRLDQSISLLRTYYQLVNSGDLSKSRSLLSLNNPKAWDTYDAFWASIDSVDVEKILSVSTPEIVRAKLRYRPIGRDPVVETVDAYIEDRGGELVVVDIVRLTNSSSGQFESEELCVTEALVGRRNDGPDFGYLAVRDSPKGTGEEVTQVDAGNCLVGEALRTTGGQSGNWWQIQTAHGVAGWIDRGLTVELAEVQD